MGAVKKMGGFDCIGGAILGVFCSLCCFEFGKISKKSIKVRMV